MTERIPSITVGSPPFYAAWSLAPLWTLLCALALAGVWLQPNHYYPWVAFHSDAWMALLGLLAAIAVLFTSGGGKTGFHGTVVGCFVFILLLLMQRATGLLPSDGLVFINVTYVAGFTLAMLVGAQSQGKQELAGRVLDTFFLGVGLASFVSVVIQLHQWLQLPTHFFWVMEGGHDRPYANLGQPNQLATLLVWGLLAVAWGVARKKLHLASACGAVIVLTVGLALTRSRTGIVEIALIVGAVWGWRRLWPKPAFAVVMAATAIVSYAAMLVLQPLPERLLTLSIDGAASAGGIPAVLDASSSGVRLAIYELYAKAIWTNPWFGYGWNQLSLAQLDMAEHFPATHVLYTHAHNLFLDIAVGMGSPAAIIAFIAVGGWVVHSIMLVKTAEEAVLLLVLLSVGVHAMLELPLHYGYFLWPAGFIIGVLNVRLKHWACAVGSDSGYRVAIAMWVVCTAAWGLVVRDYLLAEEEYRITRFEALNVGRTPSGPRPEMWALTQLGDLVWLARVKPVANMLPADLDRMRRVVSMYPALSGVMRLAEALAVNGHPEEAAMWLRRLQKVASPLHIEAGELHWMARSASVPAVATVAWPR